MTQKIDSNSTEERIVRRGGTTEHIPFTNWKIVESRRTAVPGGGKHLILSTVGMNNWCDLSVTSQIDLFGAALKQIDSLAKEFGIPANRFRIVTQGAGLATNATFHIHIILVPEGMDVMRIVESIVKMKPN